jgi:hypothetical protein
MPIQTRWAVVKICRECSVWPRGDAAESMCVGRERNSTCFLQRAPNFFSIRVLVGGPVGHVWGGWRHVYVKYKISMSAPGF